MHKWRYCDWVPCDWMPWDNHSVMHQANPDYAIHKRRYLYRLMLKGENAGVSVSEFTPPSPLRT
jgi:alpha-ketoglutarate-dependent taurine dioxygenase